MKEEEIEESSYFGENKLVVEEGKAHVGCGHWQTLDEWQKYLHVEFETGRKKPLTMITCRSCKSKIHPKAFKQLCSKETLKRYEAYMKTIPLSTNPKSLKEFNYEFDNDGKMVNMDGGFSFHYVGETHYSRVGDFITKHIQQIMVEKYGLKEHFIASDKEGAKTNIFVSEDLDKAEHIVLLIQGSGAVRAGQWARALCLNEGLNPGSILPYLEQIKKRKWGVVVFNPNNKYEFQVDEEALSKKDRVSYWFNPSKQIDLPGKNVPIAGHSRPELHCVNVFDQFCKNTNASLSLIAHSYGGVCTVELLNQRPQILNRLKCIAFTDSVHSVGRGDKKSTLDYLKHKAVNWVRSQKELDQNEGEHSGCKCVSAGHTEHEWTSFSAINSVFKYLDKHQ